MKFQLEHFMGLVACSSIGEAPCSNTLKRQKSIIVLFMHDFYFVVHAWVLFVGCIGLCLSFVSGSNLLDFWCASCFHWFVWWVIFLLFVFTHNLDCEILVQIDISWRLLHHYGIGKISNFSSLEIELPFIYTPHDYYHSQRFWFCWGTWH